MRLFLLAIALLLPLPAYAASESDYQPNIVYKTVTIDISESTTLSAAVDLHGTTPIAVCVPSTFDGTTIKFHASTSLTGTYVLVEDGGGTPADLLVTVSAASKCVGFSADLQARLRGFRYIKLLTGVQSTTDTAISLALRPI